MRIAALFACVAVAGAQAAYVEVPWPKASAVPLNVTLGYATVKSTGTRFNWYSAVLDDLSRFSVQLPAAGCAVLQQTTVTSLASKCAVATNAGYFQFKPAPTFCLGEIVINSKVVQWSGDGNPLFAVTSNKTTVIGALSQAQVAALGVTFGVAGFGTIVEGGRVSPAGESSNAGRASERAATLVPLACACSAGIERARRAIRAVRPGAEEIAPRTVAALDSAGRLLLVAIDGAEKLDLGLTLPELAEVFAEVGRARGGRAPAAVNDAYAAAAAGRPGLPL